MFHQPTAPSFDPTAALLALLQQQKSQEEYHYLAGFITRYGFTGGQVRIVETDARGAVRETFLTVTVFAHCGHPLHGVHDIGFWCPCGDIVCPRCAYTCEYCRRNFCRNHMEHWDGKMLCHDCFDFEARPFRGLFSRPTLLCPTGPPGGGRTLPPPPPARDLVDVPRITAPSVPAAPVRAQALQSPSQHGPSAYACTRCGCVFREGRGPCPSCGRVFVYGPGRRACPHCGTRFTAWECPECGHVREF